MKKSRKQPKQQIPVEIKNKLDKIYSKSKVGRQSFKPLLHKDGSIYTDIEYFELLGRKAIQLEEDQKEKNPNIPVNYNDFGYDLNVMKVAKQVAKAIDENRSTEEINGFIQSCIDYNEFV